MRNGIVVLLVCCFEVVVLVGGVGLILGGD